MSSGTKISYGYRGHRVIDAHPDDPDELMQRFQDVKADLRASGEFEITNGFVLSVLFDLYWLHAELEPEPFGPVSTPLAADGGQP